MIHATDVLKDYIKAQKDKESLADKWEITKQTLYNVLNGGDIGAETIGKILLNTGFEFEKAFDIDEEDK